MKRLFIVFIFFLTVTINSFGQEIQTKFLGLTIGKEYTLTERGTIGGYAFWLEEKDEYLGRNIRFAGYDWDFVWITMIGCDNPDKGKFRKILFEAYFEDEDLAKGMANELYDMLNMKYGDDTYQEIEGTRQGIATWTGTNGMTCRLSLQHSKSEGGDMYWYVDLLYYDQILTIEQSSKDYDEL